MMDIRYIEYRTNEQNEQTYLLIISLDGEIKTMEMTKSDFNTFYKKIFKINEELKD